MDPQERIKLMERQISGYLDTIEKLKLRIKEQENDYQILYERYDRLFDQKVSRGQLGSLS